VTWLAGRQARAQIAAALAAVAVLVLAASAAGRGDATLRPWLSALVVVTPGVLGMFWGAPLVAGELESGTFRLAWTQDVSRARWLAWRLAVPGLAAMAVAGLASLVVTWWAGPLDHAGLDQFGSFDSRGVVAVGYAALAVTLGALLGSLTRRTVPAMAATLVLFTAARVAFRLLARPRLLPPQVRALALDPLSTGYGSSGFLPLVPAPSLQPAPPALPNAWVTSIAVVDGKGTGLTSGVLDRACPGIGHHAGSPGLAGPGALAPGAAGSGHGPVSPGAASAMRECVARIATTYHEVVTYQPASRYWPLQWHELCLFLVAALALALACAWRVRRIG
jgi:hypothetical protein